MIVLAASAAFVGFVHSLAPGHWLPVVLVTKLHRWKARSAAFGAFVAALGHVVISCALGLLALTFHSSEWARSHHLSEEQMEHYSGAALFVFGLGFAAYAYFRHSHCHGHGHHGPEPEKRKGPYLFLFSLGLSPCVAVLPVFAAASVQGSGSVLLAMAAFSLGVFAALLGSTLLVTFGLIKLDHPFLEHHADVITGLGVALLGLVLCFI
jgi:cytochrome c biogenesis protein CcdA